MKKTRQNRKKEKKFKSKKELKKNKCRWLKKEEINDWKTNKNRKNKNEQKQFLTLRRQRCIKFETVKIYMET